MEANTDQLGLGGSEFCDIIRRSLKSSKSNLKTKNIIACNEDILYAWNPQDSCVITKNLRTTNGKEHECQTLLLTDPPSFDVERISVNATGTRAALSGTRGVNVLQLPRRWGIGASFNDGKKTISCRSHSLDERYFLCSPQVRVQQCRWHPGSPTDSHLLVLTSENTFRLYMMGSSSLDDAESTLWLQAVWAVGRAPSSAIASAALPFLVVLGDTAVDFDFAPPEEPKSGELSLAQLTTSPGGATRQSYSENAVWPILVLRGNGDVYLVTASLEMKSRRSEADRNVRVEGPLAMYPQAADNYGSDACALLCPSRATDPPVVVIASCSGALYHCLLIKGDGDYDESTQDENERGQLIRKTGIDSPLSTWSSRRGSTYSLQETCIALHSFECVELELGLSLLPSGPEGVEEVDTSLPCPIHLHHDPSTDSRYFCSHDTGVHVVTLPVIPQLLKTVHNKDDEDLDIPALTHESSTAEYLICTRTSSQATVISAESSHDEKINPVFGLTFHTHYAPYSLICLLSTGEMLSLPLTTVYVPTIQVSEDSSLPSVLPPTPLPAIASHSGGTSELTGKLLRESFDAHIKKILKPQMTQPILKLSPEANPTPQECLELLGHATQLFREEFIKRHDRAREEVEKRVRILRALKSHQSEEIAQLEKEKDSLQRAAEALAEKYEVMKDKQEELNKRAGNLFRLVALRQPVVSYAEKQLEKELSTSEIKAKELQNALEKVKAKQNYQQMQLEQASKSEKAEEKKKNKPHHSEIQIQAIKEILAKKNDELFLLEQRCNKISLELGI